MKNTTAHYETYKKSFENTMLPEYADYLRKMPCPEVFPDMLARMLNLVESIEARVLGEDKIGYLEKLKIHQKIMLDVFSTMAKDMVTYGGLCSEEPLDQREWKLALETFGWMWFRYSNSPVLIQGDCAFCPRFVEGITSDLPLFDAQEARWMSSFEADVEKMAAVIAAKKANPGSKFYPPAGLNPIPLADYNKDYVRDWSLPL